jgi:hydrophobic/amphiphilic exporter-1 (mainly G- bacteria), HAE1 family
VRSERSDRPTGLNKLFLKTNLNGQPTAGAAPAVGSGINGAATPTRPVIPMSAVTRMVLSVGALMVNHQGQQPAMTISFNLAPGYALGAAVDAIRQIEDEGLPGRRARFA